MFKIKRFYKPFILSLLLVLCLLGVQAVCDLSLPDLMSDIVNNGIQSKGVTNVAPEAISANGLNFMTLFMSNEDKDFVIQNYTIISKGDTNYTSKYPLAETENIYVLKDISQDDMNKMDDIFGLTSDTALNVLQTVAQQKSEVGGQGSEGSSFDLTKMDTSNLDFSKIYAMGQMIPMMPPNTVTDAREKAANTDPMMKTQIGKVFTIGFYTDLGMDVGKIQSNYITSVGLKMIGITLLSAVAAISVGFLASRMAAGVAKSLRKNIFEKVESFANEEFDKFSTASLITRSTNDITQIQQFTVMGTRMLLYSPILGIGALIMMLNKGTTMAWTLALGIGAMILLIAFAFKMVVPKIKIIQKLTDKINLVTKENLTGIMVTRAFGTQKYEENRFNDVNLETTGVNRFVGRVMGFMMPAFMLIMNLLSLLIVWVGAHAIAQSNMQVGDMMAFIQYAMQVIMAFLMIAMMFIVLPRATVSAQRIDEVLKTPVKIKDPEDPRHFDESKTGYVEFKHVSFSYDGATEKVLDDIDFVAKPR